MSIPLKLAASELRHGWKHFAVFLMCLVLGVSIMASVNTLGSVVKNSLQDQAKSLLGGDMEIKIKGVAATPEQVEFFKIYGKISYVATLRSMLHFNDSNTLIEIKAVDRNYPLTGALLLDDAQNDNAFAGNGIAIDPILLSQLDMKIGDEVKIGNGTYVVNATIKSEPDRAMQIFTFGPRVMMSQTSLVKSGLVSTFSLVDHRYRVQTPANIVANDAYEESVEEELKAKFSDTSWRVGTGTDGNGMLNRFLDQLIAFMTLSGLSTFLIAGIGIGSSVRAYLNKKSQTIAVLKVQGAKRKTVFAAYALVIGGLSIAGGLVGVAISAVITTSFMPLLGEVLPSVKGQSGVYLPASLLALWYGILIAYLFSVPALFSAINVRPSVLFRSKTAVLPFDETWPSKLTVVVLAVLLFATLFINAEDKQFITGTVVVIIAAFGVFGLCTRGVIAAAKKIHVKTPWLKMALGNMHRPGSSTGTVIYAIGISLTVLIALTLTEANFQARIKQLLNEKAPSLFMIDIQPHQKTEILGLLHQYSLAEDVMLYPMVRGRITHLAGRPVADVEVDADISWAVRGDRGLSYGAKPPKNANIVEGEWWPEDYIGEPLLSVDERFLSGMDVDIGDTITVRILGQDITAKITSARKIDYSSFQLNFSMMLSPGVIEDFPHTSLATIYLDKSKDQEFELATRIARDFPGITAIRTKEVLALVQTIVQHIATALRVTVAISLLAGLLVLISALSATINQRMYDIAILKVLGAKRSDILKSCTAEWMMLALITSSIAVAIGTVGAYLINSRLRGQEFYFMPGVVAATVVACIIVIWVIGYVGNRRLFNFHPASLLRNE
jgi:putative ABC transport system permease protein